MSYGEITGSVTVRLARQEAKVCTQARLILRLCFIALACQLLAQYHYIYGVFYRSEEPSTLYRALPLIPAVSALLISPLFVLRNLAHPSLSRRLLFYLFVIVSALALFNGLHHAREQYYFFGDLIRYALPWIILFSAAPAASIIQHYLGFRALYPYIRCLAYFAAIDAVVTILLGALGFGNKISTYLFIYLIPWAVFFANTQPMRFLTGPSLCLLLSLGAMIASSKRSNFVLFFIAVLVSVLLSLPRGSLRRLRPIALVLSLLTLLLLLSPSESLRSHIADLPMLMNQRAAQIAGIITGAKEDSSWNYRENEVRNIRLFFERADSFYLSLTGIGFGGEIPMIYRSGNLTSSGNMHHVHRGFWLYYLRHGYAGVVLLSLLFALVLGKAIFRVTRSDSELVLLWSFVLVRSISAYSSNIMMETVDIPLCAALLMSVMDRERRQSAHPSQASFTSAELESPEPLRAYAYRN